MKQLLGMMVGLALFAGTAQAGEITAKVNGLVCAFCAQGVEHSLKENAAVEQVKVDLDAGRVTIHTKEKQDISDQAIREVITKAGFTVEGIERHE
jgi:copper chaperone CopZ